MLIYYYYYFGLSFNPKWRTEAGYLRTEGPPTFCFPAESGYDWATSLSFFTFHFHALEKEMATHCSVLAWRIPGTAKPGGLPFMGSHRVRHDWSDLAAACSPYLHLSFSEKRLSPLSTGVAWCQAGTMESFQGPEKWPWKGHVLFFGGWWLIWGCPWPAFLLREESIWDETQAETSMLDSGRAAPGPSILWGTTFILSFMWASAFLSCLNKLKLDFSSMESIQRKVF